jgi:hypothetical protein
MKYRYRAVRGERLAADQDSPRPTLISQNVVSIFWVWDSVARLIVGVDCDDKKS